MRIGIYTGIILLLASSASCTKEKAHKSQDSNTDVPNNSQANEQAEQASPSDSDSVNEYNPSQVAILKNKIDLSQYSDIVVSKAAKGSSLALTSEPNDDASEIYGIDKDGKAEPIAVTEDSKDQPTNPCRERFERVYVTKKFIILSSRFGGYSDGRNMCGFVMLRKNDGALFCVKDAVISPLSDYLAAQYKWPPIQDDASGDIMYFLGNELDYHGGGYPNLYRMNFSASGDPTVTVVHKATGYIEEFTVNARGDALFKYYGDNTNGRLLRILKSDGGFEPAGDGDFSYCLTQTVDQQDFMFMDYRNILTATKDTVTNSYSITASELTHMQDYSYKCDFAVANDANVYFVGSHRVYNRTSSKWSDVNIASMVVNDKQGGSLYTAGDMWATFERAIPVGQYIYLLAMDNVGNTGVLRFDTLAKTFMTILPKGKYVLSEIQSRGEQEIILAGERLSDSANVFVTMQGDGSNETVNSSKLPEVHSIIRIK